VTVVATILILVLHNAAPEVLALGAVAVAVRRLRPKLAPQVLVSLFGVAVALGTLARLWHGPASLVGKLDGAGVAALGAVSSVAINNLPAATLLSAQPPAHPLPLLIGLNLGPNLAFTGSLSAYLWYRAARGVGAKPSLRLSSLLGLALVPLTIAVALGALAIVDAGAM
jgi:arsenical pump membrane protein